MQKIFITFVVLLSSIFVESLISQPMINYQNQDNNNYFDIKKKYDDYWLQKENQDKKGWKQYKRWEYFWSTRINEDGTFPSAVEIIKNLNEFKQQYQQSGIERIWKSVGPNLNPQSPQSGIGRINVVKFKPNTQKEIWIGAASGGVWQTKDHGASWKVFDFTQTLSMGISDIAFCYDNPNVVYVATGDADGIGAAYGSYSAGVIKTSDGGNTWNFTNLSFETSAGKIVSKLYVHPDNPDIVLAGTSDGIYKSVDGGASWRLKTASSGYYREIQAKPDDPSIILSVTYSGSGASVVYRSTDTGDSWEQVKSLNGVTRSVMSFSPVNPSVVYLLASQGQVFHSFYKSTDAGVNWEIKATLGTGVNILGYNQGNGNDKVNGQAWYDIAIAASPLDENEVYTGGINIWKTTDGGTTWGLASHWYGGYSKPYVHADIHSLFFDENSGFLYCGSDGGIDFSDAPTDRWINLNNTLSITQYYKIAVAQTYTGLVFGGSQDNGSHKLMDGNWTKVSGGDGMDCVVDYTDHNRAIVSMYYGDFQKTLNGTSFYEVLTQDMTGEAGDWVAPIAINPINPKSYYAGYTNIWKSVDGGQTWKKFSSFNIGTLKHIAISPSDTNYVYAANSGTLAMSIDGGKTFTNIKGAASPITGIAIDRNNPKRIWITVGGFSKGNKVMQYDGTNWTNMTGNLPNVPANCIIYQKNSPDRLYIGTDIGVFMSEYNSGYWELYGSQFPNIIVADLEIDYKNNLLYAGSYGRGVWQNSLNVCNEPQADIEVVGETTFCQGGSVTLNAKSSGDGFVWSNGATTPSITVTTPGIYSYSLLNGNGCVARSRSIEVKIFNVQQMKINPLGNYPICEGDTFNLELTATFGFTSYKWSTGETTRKIKITQTGKYSVTGTTKDNCEATAEFDVVITPNPAKPEIIRWNAKNLFAGEASRYQWYCNDTLLVGDTNRLEEIKKLGLYSVEIFNNSGCSSISDKYDVISGYDNSVSTTLDIFPNPTTGIIYLKNLTKDNNISIVSIFDIFGNKKAVPIEADNDLLKLDISAFSSGVYFIQLNDNRDKIYRKVVKY